MSFATKAMASGAIVTLLLAIGMSLTIRSLDANAASQMQSIRAEEQEITLAERLRWNGQMIVSTGRGYLISGDGRLLMRLLNARSNFDRNVLALRTESLVPQSEAQIAQVEAAARKFVQAQESIMVARADSESIAKLVDRFEKELLGLEGELSRSLDQFVIEKEAALASKYKIAEQQRAHFTLLLYGLQALLILLAATITTYFAKSMSSAYRKEQDARSTAIKAVAARDEILGVVAHDLRNPLNAITMKALLLSRLSESDSMRQQADSIGSIATRMEYLIKSMLDVTTMEAGKFSVKLVPCPLEDVLRQSVEIFGPLCAAKQIKLNRPADQAGLTVLVDRERIIQVLSNLLGNAVKFAPVRGEVTLSAERQSDYVLVGVHDNGVGIEPEHVPHIFNRFWKHEASQKKGTGLGLFIAKGIIDAHCGRMWVESEAGKGATFYFTLALVVQRDGEASPNQSDPMLQLTAAR
ncbi:MAG TPA: ATP-binding protein [Steroidobacteraceae bacterium]|nr:ATP-binding protein [Steroidobacteraceae bacterium]